MVYLKIKASLGSTEQHLNELERLERSNEVVNLWLPTNLKAVAFGGGAALMQVIATWASRHRDVGHIRTYLEPDIDRDHAREILGSADHLLFAFFLGTPIVASDGHTHLRDRLEPHALALITERADVDPLADALEGPRPSQEAEKVHIEESAFVLISDNHGWIAPSWLYNNKDVDGGIVSDDTFTHHIAKTILDLRRRERGRTVPGQRASNLNWTVYELFKNTHQWARQRPVADSTDEVDVDPSVRAIYARYHAIPSKSASARVGENQHFLDYVRGAASTTGVLNLLEVSILDTGFGIANRRANERYGFRKYSGPEQARALRWALARERTESRHIKKGIGFHRAFQELTELGGFMQIRSGNLFAVRDFRIDPYPTRKELESLRTDDLDHGWTEITDGLGVSGDFTVPASEVSGTRITMFFPLDANFFSKDVR